MYDGIDTLDAGIWSLSTRKRKEDEIRPKATGDAEINANVTINVSSWLAGLNVKTLGGEGIC